MISAIIGDIIGSIHENIPNHPKRTEHTITDDSALTIACQTWLMDIELNLLQNISPNLTENLKISAIKHLKEKYQQFKGYGFSSKFTKWAESSTYYQLEGHTNGCLMRQSPIAYYCYINKLNYATLNYLTYIFCSITHNHPLSHTYSQLHSHLIFQILHNTINKSNYLEKLKEFDHIQKIEFWKEKNQTKFLWKADESFQIALSCCYFATNFEEVMNNCIDIGGDVDTYCAISGPIAESLFGIPKYFFNKYEQYMFSVPKLNQQIFPPIYEF